MEFFLRRKIHHAYYWDRLSFIFNILIGLHLSSSDIYFVILKSCISIGFRLRVRILSCIEINICFSEGNYSKLIWKEGNILFLIYSIGNFIFKRKKKYPVSFLWVRPESLLTINPWGLISFYILTKLQFLGPSL